MWRLLTTDASEAFHKLRALLTFVCNDFQRGPKLLVVIGEPLKQWHALDQLMLLTCLKTNKYGPVSIIHHHTLVVVQSKYYTKGTSDQYNQVCM